jgi:threonine/homoserine/homoserine lactone efflux protein
MGDAIGQVVVLGIGVAISPVPIIAVILLLVAPRARTTGPTFVLGWLVGLSLVGAIVFLFAPDATAGTGEPARWTGWLKLLLGLGLIVLAVKDWRGRPPDSADAAMPRWMDAIDAFGAVKAGGAGVFLSALNPKNLLMSVAAAAAIAATAIPRGHEALAYGLFVVLATIGVAAPVVIYFALGSHADSLLERLREWMARNNAVIMAVLLLLIGAKLIGDSISILSI